MTTRRSLVSLLLAAAVGIGCGGAAQQASALVTEDAAPSGAPLQVAQESGEPAPQAGSQSSGGGASVVGTVRFTGTPPQPKAVQMDADPTCKQQHATPVTSEVVAVDANGMLKNVFVYVKDGLQGSFPAPSTPVVLDQAGCWYQPHVFGIQVGQPLEIVNSDATLHNVNAKPTANPPFNLAQPVKGMKTTKTFSKPEVAVPFKCNVHPWMQAYAGVVAHPFFGVSREDGSFAITGLPAGTYTIEAWHEQLGTQTQSVTVADGDTKTLELSFKAP